MTLCNPNVELVNDNGTLSVTLSLTRSTLGLQSVIFLQICNRVTALDLCQNLVFTQIILRVNGHNLTNFCLHINIDKM